MKALMLRNLRALRTPVIVVLVAIALSLVSDAVWFFGGEGERGKPDPVWYLLLPLMGWGLGCWLLARERSAQEVEFSNAWPVSRARAWAATVLSGLTVLAALLLLVSVVGAGLDWTWAGQVLDEARGDYAGAVWLIIAATLVLFALGLLMSTIAGSPFEAVGLSFVAGLVAGIGLWLVFLDFIPTRWGPQLGLWPEDLRYSATAIVAYAGMLTLAFGGASYLGYTRAPALEARRRTWLSLGAGVGLALVATVLFPLGVWLLGQPSPGDINEITWATTSPDGGWMCFSAAEPEGPLGRKRSRLWMMRPDGSGLRCIARGPQPGTASSAWEHPRWLPIMWPPGFDYSPTDLGRWLWVWDAQRQRTRKLPWQPEPMADWSDPIPVSREGWCLLDRRAVRLGDEIRFTAARLPDGVSFAGWAGDRVCFTMPATDRGPAALWSVRLPEGAGLTRITPAPGDGSWSARVSAGGKWIAWRRNAPDTVLLVVQLFGGEVAARFEGLRVYLRDCWSPDGRFLWCHDTRQLHIISLADEATERMVEAPEGWHFLGPPVHWSLDGSRLAVMCARDDGGEETPHVAVFVAHADGDGLHRIAEGRIALPWLDLRLAGWTEDGRVVIVQDRRAIVAIDPDTGEREVVLRATAMADHRGTETQRTARELQRH